jgi:Tol biopolymer transport system component
MKIKVSFLLTLIILLSCRNISGQSSLTIEKTMKGQYFTGFSPEDIEWSPSGDRLYFSWNKKMGPLRSLYVFSPGNTKPVKVSVEERKSLPSFYGIYNRNRSRMVYSKDSDIFLMELKTGHITKVTSTIAYEGSPVFNQEEDKILFTSANNLFSVDINTKPANMSRYDR